MRLLSFKISSCSSLRGHLYVVPVVRGSKITSLKLVSSYIICLVANCFNSRLLFPNFCISVVKRIVNVVILDFNAFIA